MSSITSEWIPIDSLLRKETESIKPAGFRPGAFGYRG